MRSVRRPVTSREQLLRVTSLGADLMHGTADQIFWSVKWSDIDEIVAFKIDTITFDRVCLALRLQHDGGYVATDEDTPGWNELNQQLLRTFGISFDRWFSVVAFPPFAENRTILWSRADGSTFPPPAPVVTPSIITPDSFEVTFDGAVLRRGFWLYVAEVKSSEGDFVYVGRTEDTSSPNAGSLFSRIASHLNLRPSAKGNSLFRNLHRQSLRVEDCSYRFIGIGPLFPQQAIMESHIPIRDEMAGLERAVADVLGARGYKILGDHPKRKAVRPELLTAVLQEVNRLLPGAG